MGMLSAAFLTGLGQGGQVLAGGMLKGIEQDREQSIWEKRTNLLAQIQKENADYQRKADFDFRNNPDNVQAEIGTATTKAEAAGKVARSETLLAKTDAGLRAADKTNADEDSAAATERQIQALDAKAKDPRVDAAQRKEADLAAQRLREEVKIRSDGAIRVATATAAAQGKSGKPSLSALIAEKEKAIGRVLTQHEKEVVAGLGKSENTTQALRVKLAEEAANKALENNQIKPEEKAAFVKTQLQGYGEVEANAIKEELLRGARKDGAVSTFIERMKAQGADDATIIKLGVTKDELKKATAPAAPGKPNGMLPVSQSSAASDPMRQQADLETREMNNMQRTAYSPAVQAWMDARDKTRKDADRGASEAAKAREFRLAQERIR